MIWRERGHERERESLGEGESDKGERRVEGRPPKGMVKASSWLSEVKRGEEGNRGGKEKGEGERESSIMLHDTAPLGSLNI